jgi:hypothetical protein
MRIHIIKNKNMKFCELKFYLGFLTSVGLDWDYINGMKEKEKNVNTIILDSRDYYEQIAHAKKNESDVYKEKVRKGDGKEGKENV